MKALINACTYDFVSFKERRYILFDTKIQKVGDMKDFTGADEVFDCGGCIVMPGLTNCHTHIYSTFSRGINLPFNPKNFKDILDQLWWKLDGGLDSDAVYYSGLVYGSHCIKNGVTSIIDHHASGLSIKGSLERLRESICRVLGLRGVFCFETSDRFDLYECIEENLKFCKTADEYCSGLFGMHASMSLSDKSLYEITSRIGNRPIHIHVAESMDDVSDCRKKYKKSIVERLDGFELLHKNSILAHCVHINENEAKLIKENECLVALNPTSNMNNAVGIADYDLFWENEIKCLAGSDGLGANITRDYLNLVFSMKHRLNSPVKFGIDDLIGIICNGYEYIGLLLNIKIGRIIEGYKADLVVVPYLPPTPMDESNMPGHLFFGIFDNFHPRDVFVSGKVLLNNYQLNFDEKEIFSKAKEESIKVWDRVCK